MYGNPKKSISNLETWKYAETDHPKYHHPGGTLFYRHRQLGIAMHTDLHVYLCDCDMWIYIYTVYIYYIYINTVYIYYIYINTVYIYYIYMCVSRRRSLNVYISLYVFKTSQNLTVWFKRSWNMLHFIMDNDHFHDDFTWVESLQG